MPLKSPHARTIERTIKRDRAKLPPKVIQQAELVKQDLENFARTPTLTMRKFLLAEIDKLAAMLRKPE